MLELRCTGTLHDGAACNKLLGNTTGFVGDFEVKCPKCGKMMKFAQEPKPRIELTPLRA